MRDTDWQIIYELHNTPNITKVAGILYKTQSAVTKRLQSIEEEFNVTIAERTSTGLVFTEEGEFLARQAEKYLQFERQTREGLESLRKKEQITLRLGSSYTFSKYSFGPLMKPFLETHPNLRYSVLNKQSNILYKLVLSGNLDAAFIQGDYTNGVSHTLVATSQCYLITYSEVDPAELSTLDRIGYQTSDKTTELLADWWRATYGIAPPTPLMNAGYVDFAMNQITNSRRYLLCFLPDGWEENDRSGLISTPLSMPDGTPLRRRTWFICSRDKRRSWILDRLIEYIEGAVRDSR